MRHHGGNIQTSERLQLAQALLADGRWHTTLEVARAARTEAAGSTIGDLRKIGLDVETRYAGESAEGRKMYQFRLILDYGKKGSPIKTKYPSGQMDFLRTNIGGMAVVKCP